MSLAPTTLMPPRSAGCWVTALSMAAQTWSPSNEATRPVTRASVFPARDNPTLAPSSRPLCWAKGDVRGRPPHASIQNISGLSQGPAVRSMACCACGEPCVLFFHLPLAGVGPRGRLFPAIFKDVRVSGPFGERKNEHRYIEIAARITFPGSRADAAHRGSARAAPSGIESSRHMLCLGLKGT